jgi:UDP-N-acetylglucosamine--N-acetylmuramyl-(pentapeptide) pyrophosphoryl-undecaprenol N-acetylglucosamine transferase
MPASNGRPTVLLGACGIGLGHVGRMVPVAKKLAGKGWDIVFSTYGDSTEFCLKEGFLTYRETELRYGSKEDGSLSLKETFKQAPRAFKAFLTQIGTEVAIMRRHRPDVVISDSRLSTLIAARLLGIPSVLVMHEFKVVLPIDADRLPGLRFLKHFVERIALEVFGVGWDLADKVLITDFPPPMTVCKPSVVIPEFLKHKAVFVGTVCRPKVTITKTQARKMLGLEKNSTIVYFGLSGLPSERIRLAEKLFPIAKHLSNRGFGVLFSHGEPSKPNTPRQIGSMVVYDWIPDRRLAYTASDVFVSVGGQTSIGEAMRYGLPMIIVPTPNHTEHNSIGDAIQSMGLGVKIAFDGLSVEDFNAALKAILSDHCEATAQLVAKRVEGYDAVLSITQAVEGLIFD